VQIIDWFVQMCLAVKYIHDRKILHRDIKAQASDYQDVCSLMYMLITVTVIHIEMFMSMSLCHCESSHNECRTIYECTIIVHNCELLK